MEVSGQLHAPAALPRGKSPRRLDRPQKLSVGREEEEIFLQGIELRPL
jgi:hypothetical protein